MVGVYGGGYRRGHDDVCMFIGGRWFLISMDSAIFIKMVNEVDDMLLLGCLSVTWSPKGVLLVLFFASLMCSLKRSLTRLFDSPM